MKFPAERNDSGSQNAYVGGGYNKVNFFLFVFNSRIIYVITCIKSSEAMSQAPMELHSKKHNPGDKNE